MRSESILDINRGLNDRYLEGRLSNVENNASHELNSERAASVVLRGRHFPG